MQSLLRTRHLRAGSGRDFVIPAARTFDNPSGRHFMWRAGSMAAPVAVMLDGKLRLAAHQITPRRRRDLCGRSVVFPDAAGGEAELDDAGGAERNHDDRGTDRGDEKGDGQREPSVPAQE